MGIIAPMKTFLKKLIQADSTPQAGELAASRVIQEEFAAYGIDCRVETWDDHHANCLVHVKSSGQKKALLFVCHHDVVSPGEVPWEHDPFSGLEQDGKIFGRGATDMKGGLAAAAAAIGQLVNAGVTLQGDIIFVATAGEETDSCGVIRFVENSSWLPELAGIVIPEPTGFDIIHAHRGLLWLEIKTLGKTAHASQPHLGINAIDSMKAVLSVLEDFNLGVEPHPRLGRCSMNLSTIHGGNALNVVPDQCRLGIDIRTLPEQRHQDIVRQVQARLAELTEKNPDFEATLSVIRSVEALDTDTQCDFAMTFRAATDIHELKPVGFTTDGPWLVPLNAPILIFGPGDGAMCHQPNEYILISDLERAVDYYQRIIRAFLT